MKSCWLKMDCCAQRSPDADAVPGADRRGELRARGRVGRDEESRRGGAWRWIAPLWLIAPLLATPASAEDRADIDRTKIIGNRELPKVLYIVPWKKPLPGELAGRPVESVLDEALAPVDRDVFRRQVLYDGQARTYSSAPAVPATQDTQPTRP